MEFFSFANFFTLIPRILICHYFLFLMSGSVLNLALQSLVHHDELKNVKYGVRLVEVSGTQILFHCIGLKKLAYEHVNYILGV